MAVFTRKRTKKSSGRTNCQARFPPLSRVWSTLHEKNGGVRGRSAGSFPEQRLVIEPNKLSQMGLSDEQIVWCANGTNKCFDDQIVWYLVVWKDDFSKTICPSRRNKSTTVRHKFTSDGQMLDDLFVQMICSSSSVKTATEYVDLIQRAPKLHIHIVSLKWTCIIIIW